MNLSLAWKNVWRKPGRSLVVMMSVFLGIWIGVFMTALMNGLNDQRLSDQLELVMGHFQISTQAFEQDQLSADYLPNAQELLEQVRRSGGVQAATLRTRLTGMAATASGSFGVSIIGVWPETEQGVFRIAEAVTEGAFLPEKSGENTRSGGLPPIFIGEKLAKRLNGTTSPLKVGSRIVLTFQSVEGDITSGAFKVAGLYRTNNTAFDEMHVYVRATDLTTLLGTDEPVAHHIVARFADYHLATTAAQEMQKTLPGLVVQSWDQLSPDLLYIDDMMRYFFVIFIGVILLALSMGVINTMLMAVLERTRELGMLMAVGMNRSRVFRLILTETVYLTCTGAPLGMLMAWATIRLTGRDGGSGVDLSFWSEGLTAIGYSAVIYPSISTWQFWQIGLMVVIAALLAALYPAWKALQLRPAEAIRKI